MDVELAILIVLVALGVLLWGFERYRSRFVKTDLLLAFLLSIGLLLIVLAPTVYDSLGAMLSIRRRPIAISVFANLGLLALVLYLATAIRNTRKEVSRLTRKLSVDQAPVTDGGQETISVVIPAYNEADTIESVVKSLPDEIFGYTVKAIVVSDGSVDETARQARIGNSVVVEHPINQGQGGALQTGFEVALENDAQIVVTMDADGQHPIEELERLVRPIVDGEADYVMGSRHKGVDDSDNGLVRQSGIRMFTWLINALTKSEITDCTNGYRAIRGSKLGELQLTEERFSAPELIIEARKNGLRIREIPIKIEERQAGVSKKPKLGYAVGLFRTIVVTWIR
mgnify:CR=1 FL=1